MSAALLRGAPAAQAVKAQAIDICSALSKPPVLAIVRTGSEADDLAYEKGIRGACAKCGVTVWTAQLPAYVPQDVLVRSVHRIGLDPSVDGVIVMCPRQYDAGLIGSAIGAKKDVDGMSFAEGGAFAMHGSRRHGNNFPLPHLLHGEKSHRGWQGRPYRRAHRKAFM